MYLVTLRAVMFLLLWFYIVNRKCFRFIIIQSLSREICSKSVLWKSFVILFQGLDFKESSLTGVSSIHKER